MHHLCKPRPYSPSKSRASKAVRNPLRVHSRFREYKKKAPTLAGAFLKAVPYGLKADYFNSLKYLIVRTICEV